MRLCFLGPSRIKMESIKLCFILIAVSWSRVAGNPCRSATKGPPEIVADPADCTSFYICLGAVGVRVSCATGQGQGYTDSVFDPLTKSCVRTGSQFDHSTCNNKKQAQPEMTCTNNANKFPDAENCARYFRCEAGIQEPVLKECPYPRLYDTNAQSCEVYLHVQCGTRWEPKDPCDYEANQCQGPGCVPCGTRFASCKSLPDGANIWRGRRWTPHYVICRGERVELHGDCRHDGLVELFNPYSRKCMSVTQLLGMANGPVARISGRPISGKRS